MEIEIKKIADELDIDLPDLITRSIGKKIYEAVSSKIKTIKNDETILLNFEGIKVIDASFVDEFLIKTVRDSYSNKHSFYIKLVNFSQSVESSIFSILQSLHVYANEKVILLTDSLAGNNSFYVGILSDVERDILEYLRINQSAKVEDISKFVGLNISETDLLCRELHARRVLKLAKELGSWIFISVL